MYKLILLLDVFENSIFHSDAFVKNLILTQLRNITLKAEEL